MVWWVCRREWAGLDQGKVLPDLATQGLVSPFPLSVRGLAVQSLITCREVLFSEKGELKNALMVSSTTVSTYFSSVGSGRRFSRFLHICEEKGGL